MKQHVSFFRFMQAGGLLILCFQIFNLNAQQQRRTNDGTLRQESVFKTTVPTHLYDVVLTRPTAMSITVSLLFYENKEVRIAYGISSTQGLGTNFFKCTAGEPIEIVLNDLKPDTRYLYCIISKTGEILSGEPLRFHTQRAPTSDFTFTITSDSHLDENTDTETYKTTLLNAAGDSADFHFDLGDTFMTDKYREEYKKAFYQYLAHRYYFGLLCQSSPLFFVQGNHDGESGQFLNGREDNRAVWANKTRVTYFPNPVPNHFYSGNSTEIPFMGLPQDYYSFEWGNALFVVLDPFLFSTRSGNDDPWGRTLGKEQYEWLKLTLEHSKAIFKFVFIHNLVGGVDLKGRGRGGAEVAKLYEWGGQNPDGTDGFKSNRPGWEMPIHDLLKKYHVSAVFHGHDHVFAHQEKDGIVYQCLPQPGAFKTGSVKFAEEYGYATGSLWNDAGYLRMKVTQKGTTLDYVGTNISDVSKNKKTIDTYEISPYKP